MKVLLYIAIVISILFAPIDRVDIAKLQPVEAVAIWKEGNDILLMTDAGDKGRGTSVANALENLKEKTPAVVYLDTAEFLLVDETAKEHTQEILLYLKNSIKVGAYNGGDIKEEAKWLDVHTETAKPQG